MSSGTWRHVVCRELTRFWENGGSIYFRTLVNFNQNKRRHTQEGTLLYSGLRVLWVISNSRARRRKQKRSGEGGYVSFAFAVPCFGEEVT